MPVELEAVAVYVTLPATWHRNDEAPAEKTGVATEVVMVTVCEDVFGPLQPAAVAVMVVAPVHAAVKATVPLAELMELPAVILAASKVYVIPVLLAAVAVYGAVPAPWHRIDDEPNAKTGIPTIGVIVTVWEAVAGPLQPVALAVIVEVPDHAAE